MWLYPTDSQVSPLTLAHLLLKWAELLVGVLTVAAEEAGEHEEAERLQDHFARWLKGDFVEKVLPELFTPEVDELCGKLNTLFSQEPMDLLDTYWPFVEKTAGELKAKGFAPGTVSAHDLVSAILLQPSVPLPPGHPLLQLVGVADEGEWKRLTPAQQWVRLFGVCFDKEKKRLFVKKAATLVVKNAEDGTTQSVSQERVVSSTNESEEGEFQEVLEGIEDPSASRFVAELEEQDEARRTLDHLASQVHLSGAEHIVFAGMRQGLRGEELAEWVAAQEGGPSKASAPVLATRVMTKLRAMTES